MKTSFIVIEGADGVGKSTIIRHLIPAMKDSGSYNGFLYFHWKPTRTTVVANSIPDSDSVSPRGKPPRNGFLSFLFLCWHLTGFVTGYLRFIRPALRSNKLVVGDRYAYDLFLDPTRFRLQLPKRFIRMLVRLVPAPDAVIALIAPPKTIRMRKPELNECEIERYQMRLRAEPFQAKTIYQNATGRPSEILYSILESLK